LLCSPGLPQTPDHPASSIGITGLHYHTWSIFEVLFKIFFKLTDMYRIFSIPFLNVNNQFQRDVKSTVKAELFPVLGDQNSHSWCFVFCTILQRKLFSVGISVCFVADVSR
jgi:hypothetical protein